MEDDKLRRMEVCGSKASLFQFKKRYALGFIVGAVLLSSSCNRLVSDGKDEVASVNGASIVTARPSTQCLECHEDVYSDWKDSDHENANRLYSKEEFGEAFDVHRYHISGDLVSEFFESGKHPVIKTMGPEGKVVEFTPEMVLANTPMVQFMIPFAGGRWQVTEMAWDVNNKEWFNVYGDEHRRPDEWGHWSRRGMNWNAQCGVCHTSFYEKNYDIETDAYTSKWQEMGISCQQCHGNMPEHLENPDAAIVQSEKVSSESYLESCYSCHSRREDLTGNFRIGDKFVDHHRIQLPNNERFYFPDGQIKDEDFVYGSFLMSKMYDQGVRCMDCHDPHSLKLRLPFENNQLCMQCHTDPGVNGALPIDPVSHGHHAEGSEGNRCVECHMVERTYMERDPRRDHSFHTPDPLMSQKHGVPNACSKCHEEEGLDWAIEHFESWYGSTDNIEEKRHHTDVVAAGYKRDPSSIEPMLALLKKERSPMWRGAFIQMLLEMNNSPAMVEATSKYLSDDSPIVRDAVVQSVSNLQGMEDRLQPMLEDESRLVRLDASWYLREQLEDGSVLKQDLLKYMAYTADQPGGALRWANYHATRGENEEAKKWLDKIVSWDRSSAGAWMTRGFMLNQFGDTSEAIVSFERAFEADSSDVTPLFYQAILKAELGDAVGARDAFERVIKVDPMYDRAWYNLGLAFSQAGSDETALGYIDQAISINPDSPDYLYAKATILLRQSDYKGTMKLIQQVLEIEPNYAPALRILQMIPKQPSIE